MNQRPTFSLCHTTARVPHDGCVAAYKAWIEQCDKPETVEYVLCYPAEFLGLMRGALNSLHIDARCTTLRLIEISTRDGSVKGWNAAAKASTGQVLIGVADDFFPCEHWDTELLKVIPDLNGEYVVDVDTGGDSHLLTHCILTRPRYERFGYLHHPDYLGVVADDEFTVQSFRDGVVLNARHLKFEHRHFSYGQSERDAVYDIEQSAHSWKVGHRAFAQHFGGGWPVFSLCHSTARGLHGWENAAREWIERAAHRQAIEYVLCSDAGENVSDFRPPCGSFKHVLNHGRKCAVDGWNVAAAASTGKFLITVADDWLPPKNWDLELLKLIPDLEKESVVWVRTGAPSEEIMFFSLLTRPYYERKGYIFYPEYIGMFADNDFTECALKDGVVIDARDRLPVFQHFHPDYGTAQADEIYVRQHRSEAWRVGQNVYNRRSACGFSDDLPKAKPGLLRRVADGIERALTPGNVEAAPRRRVAVCLPGETFHWSWLNGIFGLQNMLGYLGFDFLATLGHTSSPHSTRISLAEAVLKYHEGDLRTPYVLWLDDDNILPVEVCRRWIEFMEATPQCDILVGWCWMERGPKWHVSLGTFNADGTVNYYDFADVMKNGPAIRPIKDLGSGFPCVLMRREVLETLGPHAFRPIPNENCEYGAMGEDFSFFWRAKEAGMRCYFDPLGKLPHLKTVSHEPTLLLSADAPAEAHSMAQRINGKALEAMEGAAM